MPPESSRSGRRIASKACDICRLRKVQCIFDKDNTSCRRCTDRNLDCTFLSDRRQRGPPARRTVIAANLPVGELSVDHLCSPDSFRSIIDDYLQLVFPLLPLVHRPSFLKNIEARGYATNPAFLRLCVAICAATVASIPRKFDEYGQDKYSDVGAMVDRACHMVLLSRISSEPEWQSKASKETMIVSILLAMASHYAGRPDQGWIYASEAIQFFRSLVLYRIESYERLSLLEGQICKRAFWILYIIQIHDRLSNVVPHTGLSFEPLRTHWEFLLPLEIDDEDLQASNQDVSQPGIFSNCRPLPVISGFIALIKVFLCVADLLSNGYPGSPPQAFAMTSGTLRASLYPDNPIDMTLTGSVSTPAKSTVTLSALLRIVEKLQTVLNEFPAELSIPSINPQTQSKLGHMYSLPVVEQFDIMSANIHVTSLYLRSAILEACSSAFTTPQADVTLSPPCEANRFDTLRRPKMQLWAFRKSIARELLDVLKFCSTRTLEASGSSMIVKIREIAATLLDDDDSIEVTTDEERQTRHYLAQFAEVLTTLDYMGQAIIIAPN